MVVINSVSNVFVQPLTDNLTVEYFEKCNVKLQTQYSFCVSTFPLGSDKGFWSDEKCVNIIPTVVGKLKLFCSHQMSADVILFASLFIITLLIKLLIRLKLVHTKL